MAKPMSNGDFLDWSLAISDIIDLEWEMFAAVRNVGGQAACQSQRKTFEIMRRSQHEIWGDDTLKSYKMDLLIATITDTNLMTYKYGYMMKRTFPDEYEQIKDMLPEISQEHLKLARKLTIQHNAWTKEAAQRYPLFCAHGRPVDEAASGGGAWTSVENYFYSELLTYSTDSLIYCRHDFDVALDRGENLVLKLLSCAAKSYGYYSLETAEAALAEK